MATALAKLEQLRARLRRFGWLRKVPKKLLAPGLEKALVFLDERLLGATSNAVERGNRRYRSLNPHLGFLRERRRRSLEHHHPAANFTREGLSHGNLLSARCYQRVCSPPTPRDGNGSMIQFRLT
jgi:hypothetical protein